MSASGLALCEAAKSGSSCRGPAAEDSALVMVSAATRGPQPKRVDAVAMLPKDRSYQTADSQGLTTGSFGRSTARLLENDWFAIVAAYPHRHRLALRESVDQKAWHRESSFQIQSADFQFIYVIVGSRFTGRSLEREVPSGFGTRKC
jgi:hypothetical protein